MGSRQAIELAQKILIEERTSPTVRYLLREPVAHAAAPAALALTEKGSHPRTVREKAGRHLFSSENYTLLAGLYAELDDVGKARVVELLTTRIADGGAYRNPADNVRGAGSWRTCRSELPLIAEFLVRRKRTPDLLDALKLAPVRPALTLCLMQLEEMIALDFTLFSDPDYERLSEIARAFLPAIEALKGQVRVSETIESNTRFHLVQELPALCESLVEMTRKA